MKAIMHYESSKIKWGDVSAKSIICELEKLEEYLRSLAEAPPSGPFTFVSKDLVDYAKSLPEYPDFERFMKRAYGQSWELVAIDSKSVKEVKN